MAEKNDYDTNRGAQLLNGKDGNVKQEPVQQSALLMSWFEMQAAHYFTIGHSLVLSGKAS
jgi:hypothetical protein